MTQQKYLLDFSDADSSEWRVINDGVMGGISRSGIERTGRQTGMFTGLLSLENNGGFASVRAALGPADLSDWDGIELRVVEHVDGESSIDDFTRYVDERTRIVGIVPSVAVAAAALKPAVDDALAAGASSVRSVLVVRRTGQDDTFHAMVAGFEYTWVGAFDSNADLGFIGEYHYDDRDNKTPRAVYPYIGADSQDQRRFEQGRINRPYSYTRHRADAMVTWRFARSSRIKAGVDYSDYSRDFQEVRDSDEFGWLAGVTLRGWSQGSLNFNYRRSKRDVSEYIGNVPLISSYLPGTVDGDDYDNHPLLRKYYLTDRDRDEYRLRADFAPGATVNIGLAASYAEDDYDESFFGLNNAKVRSYSLDAGWYPQEHIALTGFYTREKYDSDQSARFFFNDRSAEDPDNDWFVDSRDKVDTWHFALTFKEGHFAFQQHDPKSKVCIRRVEVMPLDE